MAELLTRETLRRLAGGRSFERGEEYAALAEALVRRAGEPPLLAADLANARGSMQQAAGKLDEAFATFQRVIDLRASQHGPDHWSVAAPINNQANVRYMQAGGFRHHPLMRLTLGSTLLLLSGLWVSNLFLYFSRMGLDPTSVARYYRGSEAEFLEPRSYASMLEVTHTHLAMMALVILLLTHLAIFIPWSFRVRVLLIVSAFASAFGGEAASWLVRFHTPAWAPLKVACFLGLQASLGILLWGLAGFLLRRPREPDRTLLPLDDAPTD